jgi:comEA protein
MLHRIFFALFLCLLTLPAGVTKKKPPTQPVNINTATAAELQVVPGIGPSTAAKILQMRKSYGAFKSVNELLAIRGLGQTRLDKMRKYLTVNRPATSSAPQSASCTGCAKQKPPPPTKSAAAPKNSSSQATSTQKSSPPAPADTSTEAEEPR